MPEEIAKVIYFLTDSDSSSITGQNVVADGGASAVLSLEVGI